MVAPSKPFTGIPDTDIDADSPLTANLMEDIRDNLIHLEEWLGDGFVAAKDHDHDGVNSKKLAVAGGSILVKEQLLINDTSNSSSFATFYTVQFFRPSGAINIQASYYLQTSFAGNAAEARVNINSGALIGGLGSASGDTILAWRNAAAFDISSLAIGWHLMEIELRHTVGGAQIATLRGFQIQLTG